MLDIAVPRAAATEREAVQSRFAAIRRASEALAAGLSPEDQAIQSMPDVSPTKWHLAHTSWFFETFLLGRFSPNYRPFDPAYAYLFNSYYEAVGPRHPRPQRGLLSRPSIEDVAAYRDHVTSAILRLIGDAGEATWRGAAPLIELGLHHEQQHQELILMDIKHVFSMNPLQPAYLPPRPSRLMTQNRAAPPRGWVEFPSGLKQIGHDGDGFAFDNEGPRHKVWLEPFRLATHPVSCGEYRAFIAEGGYRRPEFWLSDGWAAVQALGWEAPLYWRCDSDNDADQAHWFVFTLAGECPLDPDESVCHVSFYEADAYARWAGHRLPTEAEWEVAASAELGAAAGTALESGANLADAGVFHPAPERSNPPEGVGLRQLVGDVWEWTASPYVPYPRFRPAAGAIGEYNGKFMSNQMVLRGGAAVTPAGHIRVTYRNFFPPTARWAFSGLRLAEDV